MPEPGNCVRCGYITSQDLCKACVLLEGLNSGNARQGVMRTRKVLAEGVNPLAAEGGARADGLQDSAAAPTGCESGTCCESGACGGA